MGQNDKAKEHIQKAVKEILDECFGSSFGIVLSWKFRDRFSCNPYLLFLENPQTFYRGLEDIFGAGAEVIIRMIGRGLMERSGENFDLEEFVKLVMEGDESSLESFHKLLSRIAGKMER